MNNEKNSTITPMTADTLFYYHDTLCMPGLPQHLRLQHVPLDRDRVVRG